MPGVLSRPEDEEDRVYGSWKDPNSWPTWAWFALIGGILLLVLLIWWYMHSKPSTSQMMVQ
jgi:uncharacterized integral membrane protein